MRYRKGNKSTAVVSCEHQVYLIRTQRYHYNVWCLEQSARNYSLEISCLSSDATMPWLAEDIHVRRYELGGEAWKRWLKDQNNRLFYFDLLSRGFSVRREIHGMCSYWYAYRRHKGKLYKIYVGKTAELSLEILFEVAKEFESIIHKG